MRDRRLGLGFCFGAGAMVVASAACSSGGTDQPLLYQPPSAGGSSGAGGASGGGSARGGTNGQAAEAGQGAGGANEGGDGNQPGSGGSGATGGGAGSGAEPGAGVGEECTSDATCRPGLECAGAVCEPAGSFGPGEPCVIQPECESGLQCIASNCVPEGDGEPGDECRLDDDCAAGNRCVISGLSARCAPQGDGDLGADCALSSDCFGGLTCAEGTCAALPPGLPAWEGVDCDPPDDDDVRAYFEVPGAPDADEGDFFRLPFPNDARRTSSGLDLDGFPTPGSALLGVDPVALYVDALSGDEAWGSYSSVYFRFSGALDLESLRRSNVLSWVDITAGEPEFGSSVGLGWYYSGGRTPYLCEHWIGARRPRGYPMLPGHTYAVWITTDVVGGDGDAIRRAPNLVSVLADSAPSDTTLRRVHTAYAPFRQYLDERNISPATVLNATVFTVGGVRDAMAELADTVEALPAPSIRGDWVECADGVDSPCPDAAGERACGDGTDDYSEFHALVRLPIFQEGTPPYLTPDDGGGIDLSAEPGSQDVCLSLTVPKGAMPTAGWPLVVFAHGTGGSFRSHVTGSIAGALSAGSEKFAVLGIDQVAHGPRRVESMEAPDQLFFNFLNPAASRGNPLQGAADQLSLAKFAASIDGTGEMPTTIDGTKLVFFGHSQGATEGSLMLPYADAYKAAVLSGNGASLLNALITKTEPTNIAAVLPIVLSDLEGATGGIAEYHPVLSLLQTWIDPADPLNFASAIALEPPSGRAPKHLFQTYGLGDHYSPPVTLEIFAVAGGLTQVEPELDDIGLSVVQAPLAGNEQSDAITLGMRQYEPVDGEDGHFVVFDVEQANDDVVRFLTQAVGTTPPQIGD